MQYAFVEERMTSADTNANSQPFKGLLLAA
jgi:hypothetical protein